MTPKPAPLLQGCGPETRTAAARLLPRSPGSCCKVITPKPGQLLQGYGLPSLFPWSCCLSSRLGSNLLIVLMACAIIASEPGQLLQGYGPEARAAAARLWPRSLGSCCKVMAPKPGQLLQGYDPESLRPTTTHHARLQPIMFHYDPERTTTSYHVPSSVSGYCSGRSWFWLLWVGGENRL